MTYPLHLYPQNWPSIAAETKARTANRCTWCDLPHGAKGYRDETGQFFPIFDGGAPHPYRVITIVISAAHIYDPNPANCAPHNLAGLCQQCHNRHDALLRAAHRRATWRARRALADLFADPPTTPGGR